MVDIYENYKFDLGVKGLRAVLQYTHEVVIELIGAQFGLDWYTWFQNQSSVQGEFATCTQ